MRPALGGVGGQVRADVGVGGGPVPGAALTRGNEAGQRAGDGPLVGALVAALQQVLSQRPVIQPVGRPAVG